MPPRPSRGPSSKSPHISPWWEPAALAEPRLAATSRWVADEVDSASTVPVGRVTSLLPALPPATMVAWVAALPPPATTVAWVAESCGTAVARVASLPAATVAWVISPARAGPPDAGGAEAGPRRAARHQAAERDQSTADPARPRKGRAFWGMTMLEIEDSPRKSHDGVPEGRGVLVDCSLVGVLQPVETGWIACPLDGYSLAKIYPTRWAAAEALIPRHLR